MKLNWQKDQRASKHSPFGQFYEWNHFCFFFCRAHSASFQVLAIWLVDIIRRSTIAKYHNSPFEKFLHNKNEFLTVKSFTKMSSASTLHCHRKFELFFCFDGGRCPVLRHQINRGMSMCAHFDCVCVCCVCGRVSHTFECNYSHCNQLHISSTSFFFFFSGRIAV